MDWQILETAEEAERLRGDIEEVVDGWFSTGPIDWDELVDRLERRLPEKVCCSEDWSSPFLKRVKQIAKAARAASA